ncbi:MAG: hypothetical protein DMG23_10925 [Acidobacteria bacterium]|nr:MAG: hypothetical protein DMG23_10925 [Acidobacteriota bacterium]
MRLLRSILRRKLGPRNAVLAIVPLAVAIGYGLFQLWAAPQAAGPLAEEDVVKLLAMGASHNAITALVRKYGISFQPEEGTLRRLRNAGAQETLLQAIRSAAPPPKAPPKEVPAPSPASPGEADAAVLVEAARHLELAQLRALNRDFDGAFREYAEAQRIRPRAREIYFQRGLLLAELGRYSEAAANWKKYLAVAGSGTDAETFTRKIVEWESQAEKDEKVRRLAERGYQALADFNADGAVNSFQDAVGLNYSVSDLLNLAGACLFKGDYESPTVQNALILNPELAYGYALLGAALRQNDSRSFQVEAGGAARPDPNTAMAHNRLGWVLWNEGNFRDALRELHKAAEIDPKSSGWYADLAYGLIFRGDTGAAQVAAREALRLKPSDAGAHDAMGLALESKGSIEQAAQEFREALRLSSSTNSAFLQHLNRVTGKRPEAH